jgi:hypothetical protein
VESSDSEDESQSSDKSYETDESEMDRDETEEYYGEEPGENYWESECLDSCGGDVEEEYF